MRPALRQLMAGLFALAVLAGCGEVSDSGLSAQMRVAGARHYPGEVNAPDGGPELAELTTTVTRVRAGTRSKSISGVAEKGTLAIALSFSGEPGHWRIVSGAINPYNLEQVTFEAQLSFSPEIAPGHYEIVARALDEQGRAGPAKTLGIDLVATDVPDGALAITVRWDTNADLDLHVATPDNVEIWAGDINSYQPPTVGIIDPEQVAAGGVLLDDSNSQCAIDGRREETVRWTQTPPSGHYIVRVDTFSLCGTPGANWVAEARLNGELIASATGSSIEADTRVPHGKGAGLLAFEFDLH